MRSMKKEAGFGSWDIVGVVFILCAFILLPLWGINNDQKHVNFNNYFQMEASELKETELIKPMVAHRLTELENIAKEASSVSMAIKSEPPSLTPDKLKYKLEMLKDAQIKEHDAWYNWRKACEAAKYYDFVKECKTT